MIFRVVEQLERGECLFTDPNTFSDIVVHDEAHKVVRKHCSHEDDEHPEVKELSETELERRRIADQKRDPDDLTPEEKIDRLRAVHDVPIITFPVNHGISGLVFSTEKIFKCNDAEKETNFSGSSS